MRITVVCADLSQNALSRANLVSEILALDHEVDLIGTRFGAAVWAPARDRHFAYVAPGARRPWFARTAAALRRAIRGDLVFAMKPLPSSYGIALEHRRRTGVPIVLDIDDEELSFRPPPSPRNPRRLLSSLLDPNGRRWTERTIARAAEADAVTVASTGLRARYGGVIVPHAKDTDRLRPRLVDRDAARRAAGLEGLPVVMFMGTPRPFKGIEDAAEAVQRMTTPARFVLVGADANAPYVRQLVQAYPGIRLLPPYGLDDVASLLEMADVVVVPQRLAPQTVHQQPSKLLDAMALAKPVVATDVADIGAILSAGRGSVVPPGDVGAMAAALDRVLRDPIGAAAMGARAREWVVEHGSYRAMRVVLGRVIEEVL